MRFITGLLIALAAQAATPLFHGSFDKSSHGWTVIRGMASPDSAVLHNADRSLRVEPAGAASDASVRSSPLSLTIGKRYELSGWVRTEKPPGPRCRPLADRHRRGALHGLHAVRRALGFPRRHPAVDAPLAEIRRQPRAGPDPADAWPTAARFQGKAWFEGVSLDEVGAAGRVARPRSRPDVRPRLPLSGRRLDLSPHRRRAVRARLPARLPDGARDSRIPGTLRRRSRHQGRARWTQSPHHGQCAFPARLRSRDPGGDARHRRWRLRRRRQVAGPPHRPGRHRGRQRRPSNWASCAPPSRVTPTGLERLQLQRARLLRSEARFRARSLQRLRRHRPRHARRQNGHRPRHLVAADARRADQRHGSISSPPTATAC